MRTRLLNEVLPLAGVLSGIGLVPAPGWAQTNQPPGVIQPPSAFGITVDGFFTDPTEWTDVTPIEFVFSDGSVFTYTALDPGLDALYLMYDATNRTDDFTSSAPAASVEFNVGVPVLVPCPTGGPGHHYVVNFTDTGIVVLQDGCLFNATGIMEGARFFGLSPNSSVPHRMFELEVAFDCSDPTLNCPSTPGVYSPDPAYWGATATHTDEPPHCEKAVSPDCDAPPPIIATCADQGAFEVFGDRVSAACTEVLRNSGGIVHITKTHLPSESPMTLFCAPGVSGINSCPCGNPQVPAGSTKGCNNFAGGGTGGAILSGAGVAVTNPGDTLQFNVTNGVASNVTVLFQGTTNTVNTRSGAGLRCVGGTLKRLFKGNQAAGAISFPNNGSTVHDQSSAKGYTIVAPVTLYYYCAYRNSAANGQPGCPGFTFGFNTSNAGAVRWQP